MLGANTPDIDVFLGWVPWAPLATHRGFTHSLVGGVLVMPPMLAGLLWLLDRWQIRRGDDLRSDLPMHFGWLVALSYLATLTHPLLDWQTSYAIHLFAPFDRRWYHTDALFIADVWIWSGLAFAIWLSRRRERRGQGRWGTPAITGLALLTVYIAANGVLSEFAREAVARLMPPVRPDIVVASPPPVLFWRRDVVWRQDHAIAGARFDPLVSLYRLDRREPVRSDGMTLPPVRRAAWPTARSGVSCAGRSCRSRG